MDAAGVAVDGGARRHALGLRWPRLHFAGPDGRLFGSGLAPSDRSELANC